MCTSKSEKHWFGDSGSYLILKKFFLKYLFIWLHWILVTAFRILHCGMPGGASGKEPSCQCRRHKRHEFNPWVRKIPGGGHGNSLQYSCLENPRDRRAWWAAIYGVAQGRTWLSDLAAAAAANRSGIFIYSLLCVFWVQKKICFIDYARDFHCGSQQMLENTSNDRNTRPPDLPPQKSVCRSGSNS